jgi:hypothetical protein
MPRETSSLGRAGWRSGPRKSGIFRRGKTPGMAFPWPLVGGLVSAVVADPGGAFAGTKRRGLAMPGFRQSGGPVAHENQLLMKTLAPPPRPVFGGAGHYAPARLPLHFALGSCIMPRVVALRVDCVFRLGYGEKRADLHSEKGSRTWQDFELMGSNRSCSLRP